MRGLSIGPLRTALRALRLDSAMADAVHGPHHGRRPGHAHAVGRCPRCCTRLRQAHGRVGHRRRAGRGRERGRVRRRGPATAWPTGCPRASSVEQHEGEGTGAAVLAARDAVERGAASWSSPATTRWSRPSQIAGLLAEHARSDAAATLLTTEELDPAGYGRIVRDGDGVVERIVETKDTEGVPGRGARRSARSTSAPTSSRRRRCSTALDARRADRTASSTSPAPSRCSSDGGQIVTRTRPTTPPARMGVNDRAGLMEAEELAQRRILEEHARAGVTFLPRAPPASRPA